MSYKFKPKLQLHTHFQIFINMKRATCLVPSTLTDWRNFIGVPSLLTPVTVRRHLFCSCVSTLMTRRRRRLNGGIGKLNFSITFVINAAVSANIWMSESSSMGVSYKVYIASPAHSLYLVAQPWPRTRQRSAVRGSPGKVEIPSWHFSGALWHFVKNICFCFSTARPCRKNRAQRLHDSSMPQTELVSSCGDC